MKRKRNMAWTRFQEEFEPRGRNKLVKRSDNPVDVVAAYYSKIGTNKLVRQVDPAAHGMVPTRVPAKHPPTPPKAPFLPPKICKELSTAGASKPSTALPRKLGRNKLVFAAAAASRTAPPVPLRNNNHVQARVSATEVLPPPMQRGRNQLILTKQVQKSNEESSSISYVPQKQPTTSEEEAATAKNLKKHLRANYKSTKSGLKRVEPPICIFFQQRGMCFDEHCPYRHVKIGRLGNV
jgi:hypothetical protein